MRHTLYKLNTRLLALAMAVMLLLCYVPAASAAEYEGSCGENLTWSFSEGTLTISGSGAMRDYPENNMAPWYFLRDQIAEVELPDGLTRIGDLAFYGCKGLKIVRLPDSVTSIGWHAFDGCTALAILDLGDSLQVIGDGAFQNCVSLPDLRLPDTLTDIGFQAFYRCESLSQITIPASVKHLGMTAFAFCYQLIRAEIQAQITRLPDWTFYGCGRLNTVVLPDSLTGSNELAFYGCTNLQNVIYNGSEENRAQIESDIQRDLTEIISSPNLTDQETEGNSSVTAEETEDSYVFTDSSATGTDNASVSTDVTTTIPIGDGDKTVESDVTVSLETAEGWDDISESVAGTVENSDSTVVDVYIKDDTVLSAEAFADLVGKNVVVTVHTADGAAWKIDFSTVTTLAGSFNLSYQRAAATEEQLAEMHCYAGYMIRFLSTAEIDAEVMIRLPMDQAYHRATLFVDRDGLEAAQTVIVDTQGYAHFYLASVDAELTYLIGIDSRIGDAANAIIPDTMYDVYGMSGAKNDVEYVITGRTSSWGMNINQVTWIMIAVLVSCVVVVGFVMYAMNKRKLRMGYVPDLDDVEYD